MKEIYNMEDKKLKESELEKVSGGDSGGAKIEPIESERPSIPGPANPLPQEPVLPKSGKICPFCGSDNVIEESMIVEVGKPVLCLCKDCRKSFKL